MSAACGLLWGAGNMLERNAFSRLRRYGWRTNPTATGVTWTYIAQHRAGRTQQAQPAPQKEAADRQPQPENAAFAPLTAALQQGAGHIVGVATENRDVFFPAPPPHNSVGKSRKHQIAK
jgi:hypothetical protein